MELLLLVLVKDLLPDLLLLFLAVNLQLLFLDFLDFNLIHDKPINCSLLTTLLLPPLDDVL